MTNWPLNWKVRQLRTLITGGSLQPTDNIIDAGTGGCNGREGNLTGQQINQYRVLHLWPSKLMVTVILWI